MKILFSSCHNPYFETITEYIESAISALGYGLIFFNDRQHIIPGRIRRRINFMQRFDLTHINNAFISLAEKVAPDIAIIAGGHRITSDTIKIIKEKGIVTVLWIVDAPSNFHPIVVAAPFYDHIFCQGTEGIELLEQSGITGARWLPMGCSPFHHYPVKLTPVEKESGMDVVFVGSNYTVRRELFEKLVDFDFGIWGPGWEQLPIDSPLQSCIKGGALKPEKWLSIYSSSKIVLAPHYQDTNSRFPVYQASPRVFEALACRAFLIVDRQKDVFSLFNDHEHLVGYDDAADLRKKITYYLYHPMERKKIAQNGYNYLLSKHTYEDRIREMLSIVIQTNLGKNLTAISRK